MKIGDVSRRRRFTDPARQRWYAHYRAVRFARRLLGAEVPSCPAASAAKPPSH